MKYLIYILLIGFFFITSCKTQKKLNNLGFFIEAKINAGEFRYISDRFKIAPINKKINNYPIPTSYKNQIKGIVFQSFQKQTNTIFELALEGKFKFLNSYKKRKEKHLVFLLETVNHFEYIDYIIEYSPLVKFEIVDTYSFWSGQSFTGMFDEAFNLSVNSNVSQFNYYQKLIRIKALIENEDYQNAWNQILLIDEEYANHILTYVFSSMVALKLELPLSIEVINILLKEYGDVDDRLTGYYNLILGIITNNSTIVQDGIELLQPYIGNQADVYQFDPSKLKSIL